LASTKTVTLPSSVSGVRIGCKKKSHRGKIPLRPVSEERIIAKKQGLPGVLEANAIVLIVSEFSLSTLETPHKLGF
jgi:hypothetical protein